ncbi:MAG TPA: PAS domain S-box protein [Terriglobales bacterium]|nr:PAS domain S-box protein [Terriglobales bacterium]
MYGMVPPTPPSESKRLEKLRQYRILDSPPEPVFDNLTRLASLLCNTPMSVITLVDERRQWFKSRLGIEIRETPREIAFCSHAIEERDLFIVKDARSDPRFADNPMVTGDPEIRFYAGAPLTAPGGCNIGTLAVIDRVPRDLTDEQRKALMLLAKHVVDQLEMRWSLEHRHQALRAVVEACPLAIIGVDLKGRVLMWNESAEQMFGYTENEVRGNLLPIIPAGEDTTVLKMAQATGKDIIRDFETRRVRKDGVQIDVSISAAPMLGEHGEVFGVMGVLEDVTQRKLAREQLERSVSLLRATLESTADGLLAVDRQGHILMFNERLAEMWHIPKELLESDDLTQVIEQAAPQLRDPEHFIEKIRRFLSGEDFQTADVLQFKDGRIFERYSLPQVIGGEVVGRVFSYRDITRRTQLEEQLRHAQKMEAIGQLAGGIAHDFNNLLNVIVGYTALIQARAGNDLGLLEHAGQVMKAADRATALTRQLLVFSRKQVLQTQVLDLNKVVSDLTKMLPRVLGEDISLSVRLGAELGSVKADPGQIEQVLMNLCINARDAMPNGGQLEIGTYDLTVDEQIGIAAPGDYVVVSVRDTGQGMTEDVRAHIFEPFFTTKQPGKGTGLGLATVYAIVRQSDGFIDVQSEPGQGSLFRVYLPRVQDGTPSGRASEGSSSHAGGSETILVVEDEASLRELIVHVLKRWGYTVLEAQDGAEAIGCAEKHGGPIDLLLTDVVMPGMRGWEVTERIQRIRPDVKVLYISGYADDLVPGRSRIDPEAAFLQKPFTPDALANKVREVLTAD